MTDGIIKSPCILVCAIEPASGHCYGCGRSRNEIADWINYTAEDRDRIMEILPERVAQLERKPRRVTRRSRQRGAVARRTTFESETG